MNFWQILKIIAGIIANLPFDAEEQDVKAAVEAELVTVNDVGIPGDTLRQLIDHIVGIILILRDHFGKK